MSSRPIYVRVQIWPDPVDLFWLFKDPHAIRRVGHGVPSLVVRPNMYISLRLSWAGWVG